MILVFTDSDGVLKESKQRVSERNIRVITRARMERGVVVIRITGAPAHHLDDGLLVDRAFGESGGVERLAGGTVVAPHAGDAKQALDELKQALNIVIDDGLISTPYGAFGVEGVRRTTLCLFFGQHPLYADCSTSADPDMIARLVNDEITARNLPLYLMRGRTHTYEYFDIGHPDVMKKERIVLSILESMQCKRAYYLGDAGNDAGAMQLDEIIPVTFSNGTPEIKQIVVDRNGILIDKPGPHGGSEEFFRRLIDGEL